MENSSVKWHFVITFKNSHKLNKNPKIKVGWESLSHSNTHIHTHTHTLLMNNDVVCTHLYNVFVENCPKKPHLINLDKLIRNEYNNKIEYKFQSSYKIDTLINNEYLRENQFKLQLIIRLRCRFVINKFNAILLLSIFLRFLDFTNKLLIILCDRQIDQKVDEMYYEV